VGSPEEAEWAILEEVSDLIPRVAPGRTPIEVGREVQRIVAKHLGTDDPYREAKRRLNEQALALYPRLKAEVTAAPDPLFCALSLAAVGNVADLGANSVFDLVAEVEAAKSISFSAFHYQALRDRLAQAKDILYIADNAGEIVFDRLVIEELLRMGKRVSLAVRGGPTLNDATLADARQVGLTELVPVITTGSELPGVLLARSSPEFQEYFRRAELVIAKGMGNFEGLSGEEGPIFFLLRAKCGPVAQETGVGVDEVVLKAG
jgi:hypothetical protein